MKAKYSVIILCFCLAACNSAKHDNPETLENLAPVVQFFGTPKQQPLKLTFAGDIMAHTVNYQTSDYNLIYEDIAAILYADDVSFANLETPVCNELPYESYPTFNVQTDYAEAAIVGGFDAFSLANNHTNDQSEQGITSTLDYFNSIKDRGIYSAGIKNDSSISYDIIALQGWTILFAAITEFANSQAYSEKFDMYTFSEKGKEALLQEIQNLQNEQEHDIFVLGVHVGDAEYVTSVSDARRNWFYTLLDAGVDIVWANHPHVTKEWEIVKNIDGSDGTKLIMHSIGNTISGQTYNQNYENPLAPRENTGTSLLLQVDICEKIGFPHGNNDDSCNAGVIMEINPIIIVTHREENNDVVIKQLTPEFIETQNEKNATYYVQRLEYMKTITGKITWR